VNTPGAPCMGKPGICRQFLSLQAPIRGWKPDAGYPAIAQLA